MASLTNTKREKEYNYTNFL